MNVLGVRESDWKKDDGTTVKVTTVKFEDGSEVPGYDLPSVPEVGKPLPEGWEVATAKSGKSYIKVPKAGGKGGFGGAAAYRNTKEGQAYEQERMDRRTALMQAVALNNSDPFATAALMYDWLRAPLQESSVATHNKGASSGKVEGTRTEGGGQVAPQVAAPATSEPSGAQEGKPVAPDGDDFIVKLDRCYEIAGGSASKVMLYIKDNYPAWLTDPEHRVGSVSDLVDWHLDTIIEGAA